jgi:hypothetical protein
MAMQMKGSLRNDNDWKNQYGKKEADFRKMFEKDLEGILKDPKDYSCKLKIWVRYVGGVAFYDWLLRSGHRKFNPKRTDRNEWLLLSVRTLGDTPLDKGGKTCEPMWTDIRFVLREFPGKRDLQLTLKSPTQEITAMDVRFAINGINPETNYDAVTRQDIFDALNEKFGWAAPKRRIKKRELVDIWLEAVNTEGKSLDLEEDITDE